MKTFQEEAIALLQKLISLESFSKTEDRTADAIEAFLKEKGIATQRYLNNVWASNKYFDEAKQTLLLNSHHDTVKPNSQYTRDPFAPVIENGKIFGLGSNDAGGPLVSLLACFLHFYDRSDLNFNLIYAATAEEEISGKNGVEAILPKLSTIHCGIVGEPTKMEIAIAEKGLLVIDCVAHGIAGHAARDEGENAIYLAMKDMEWFRTFAFPKVSETLGPVKMTVSMISAGIQHNIVPGTCAFTVDIRTTDEYSNAEALHIIEQNVTCSVVARSLRLNASSIPEDDPLVIAGITLGIKLYGSPTTSDQAVMHFPTIKMGPGDSARSHTADEFIYLSEIEDGIHTYINLLNKFNTL
ncbi:MAG: M20 family metallo-hydrolase [Bacteroidota bacterium]|nr:M20 family metallo-hydrolase [Bacteroidota bacterium]